MNRSLFSHLSRRAFYIGRNLVIISFFGIASATAFSQVSQSPPDNFLLGVIFKLEELRDSAAADIRQLENLIRQGDQTIAKAERVIGLARQQGNAEAETIARNALATANETRRKNIESKTMAESILRQIDFALGAVKNRLSVSLGNEPRIESMVTNFKGRVSVQKKGEKPFEIDPARPVFLEKGDVVRTYDQSSVELQLLEGRGRLMLGEYSQVEMAEETDGGLQSLKLIQGKIDIGVEKLENFEKDFKKKIEAYEADLKTTRDEIKQRVVDQYRAKKASLFNSMRKLEVRTPAAVTSDRGTRFIIRLIAPDQTEVIVFEGEVEVKPLKTSKKFIIEAGYRAIFSADGVVSGPAGIDPSKVEMR